MGLFTKRRKAPAGAAWLPEDDELFAAPGAEMDDDGCAGEQAHGARFYMEDAPGASLTVWAYASFAGPDDPADFCVGYRCDYEVDDGSGDQPWRCALYGQLGDEFHDDLGDADRAALIAAGRLNFGPRSGADEEPAGTFDWDGVPW